MLSCIRETRIPPLRFLRVSVPLLVPPGNHFFHSAISHYGRLLPVMRIQREERCGHLQEGIAGNSKIGCGYTQKLAAIASERSCGTTGYHQETGWAYYWNDVARTSQKLVEGCLNGKTILEVVNKVADYNKLADRRTKHRGRAKWLRLKLFPFGPIMVTHTSSLWRHKKVATIYLRLIWKLAFLGAIRRGTLAPCGNFTDPGRGL